MKKTIGIMVAVIAILLLGGCNHRLIDTKWTFNYAYIVFPDGSVEEIEVKSWTEDDSSVTIQAKDGNVYCVSMHNCIMTQDRWVGYSR